MPTVTEITVRIRIAWWVPVVMSAIVHFAHFTGKCPSEQTILRIVRRGVHAVVD